jgi:RimJ/RimL family protein N-acetyltransferase
LIRLVETRDDHFAWMLGERPRVDDLDLPPDGIDVPSVIRFLRRAAADLRDAGCGGSWLIVEGPEVIGLCSYKAPPDPARAVEIGYGIAAERRGRGCATQALGLMLREARSDPAIDTVTAETATGNIASQTVLARNGFRQAGARSDADEGELILWSIDVSTGG